MEFLKFIGETFKKFPILLSFNILLILFMTGIEVTSILTLAPVVDIITNPELNTVSPLTRKIFVVISSIGIPITLINVMIIFLFFNFIKSGVTILVGQSLLKTKYSVVRDVILSTFNDFFSARWGFFQKGAQGTFINTFVREITIIGDAFGAMTRLLAKFILIIMYFAIPFYISWKVTSFSLVSAVLLILPFMMIGKISIRLGRQNTSTAKTMNSVIIESLSMAKIILGFGNQYKSAHTLSSAFEDHRKATLKSQTLSLAIPQMYNPFGILILLISSFIAQKLLLPISETVVLLYSLLKVIPMIGQFATEKHTVDNFFPSYEYVINLRQRAKEMRQPTGKRIFTGSFNEIIISDLYFAYPGCDPSLINLNMLIPKGKMIAIVGKSGAGKSTLIDVIVGFNEPISGEIKFDNTPLQEFDINSYRKRIGYVPQESILFNTTIAGNLQWAKDDATDEEIQMACKMANADEFIEEFAEGYNTVVGDRGVRLSGGQLQRVALARAIIRKPDILILDEATSSLDTKSERQIQEAIERISKDTTIIVIAHRLSTILKADYIYVLDKGEITETGDYKTLMANQGLFRQMIKAQEYSINEKD